MAVAFGPNGVVDRDGQVRMPTRAEWRGFAQLHEALLERVTVLERALEEIQPIVNAGAKGGALANRARLAEVSCIVRDALEGE